MKPHNIKDVKATISFDGDEFKCVVRLVDGGKLEMHGYQAIGMFLNMLDMFEINDDEDEQETIH